MNMLCIAEMSWIEYKNNTHKILIIPIGATEQHGPHLPLSVDSILAERFSLLLAKELRCVVAPVVSYGYKSKPLSGGGPLFPGTIDLNGITLQYLVSDLLEEFILDGFTKIILFNCHFENEAFIIEAMDHVSSIHHDSAKLILLNWWDGMSDEVLARVFNEIPFPGWALEHAALTETSLMLYFCPELVRQNLIQHTAPCVSSQLIVYPVPKNIIPANGMLASAATSSKEKGEIIVNDVISRLTISIPAVFSNE